MSAVPTTLEELNSLFVWNPPPLRLDPAGRHHIRLDTESTRQAAFYDKHFAPDIICKQLVHTKNLHHKVAAVVDEKLQSYNDAIMLLPRSGIISTKLRDSEVEETEDMMKDEMSVVEFYSKTTTRYCLRIASTLALHPTTWSSILSWSAVPCLGGRDIPGGSLQVLGPRTLGPSDEGNLVRSGRDFISEETWRRLMEVRDKYEDLATWRMMSPAEDTEVMLGLSDMAYAGNFQWSLCPSPTTLSADKRPKFLSPNRHLDSPEIMSFIGELEPLPNTPVMLEEILDDTFKRGGSSLESVREHDRMVNTRATSWSDDDTDEIASSRDPAQRMTTQALVQEIWGQSVRQNTTLIIIHSGNLECICIRHRASQTLYISDILHVPRLKEPGYGKLQVGLYISAVDDAMLRVVLEDTPRISLPSGNAVTGVAQKPEEHLTKIKSSSKRARRSDREHPRKRGSGDSFRDLTDGESDGLEPDTDQIELQASLRNELYLQLQYDVYESIHPARFHRGPRVFVNNDRSSSASADVLPTDPHILLTLTSRLGQGAMGVTHGGFVQTDFGLGQAKLKIAAKLAFTDDQQEDITHEHAVYTHLNSSGVRGIPTAYGIFHDAEDGTGPSCLLMSHAGVSLRIKKSISPTPITLTQRDAFVTVLRSIHDANVLHRDLRLENLLVQDSGDVAIIDFDQAVLAAEDGLEQEDEQLRFLLEDLVGDHVEAIETSGIHGTRGNVTQVETAETPGIRRRGKARDVSEGKTRIVAAVDTAPKPDVQSTTAKTKEDVAEMDPKHQVTANVTMVAGSEIRATQVARGLRAPTFAGRINDNGGPNKPRMSGRMVLRPKPPRVSR